VPLDLRISLSKLELFCLAAELQSFGRAAEQSFITQPVMTSHMRSLSERLGADLFVRNGNRMVLTQEGRVAYEWARDALARAKTMFRQLEQIEDGSRGSVVVSASDTIGSYILPDIVADFTCEFPHVDVTLLVGELGSTVRAVEIGERDFALIIAHPEIGRVSALTFEEIGHEELILVGPCVQDSDQPELERHDIANLDVLGFPRGSFRQRLADWFLGEAGIPDLDPVMELGSTEGMKRALRRGLGVAFLFRSTVSDELNRGELQELKLAGVTNMVPIYLIRRRDHAPAPLERRLLSSVREALVQREEPLAISSIG
jgi:DNA-binding transcriptional LysR family regulator